MTDLWARDAWDLADDVRRGGLSAVELLDVALGRIEKLDGDLNAVCYLDADGAREQARAIDAEVAAGNDPGPFAGIPMGVKELAQAKGFPDTHASVMYKDRVAAVETSSTELGSSNQPQHRQTTMMGGGRSMLDKSATGAALETVCPLR